MGSNRGECAQRSGHCEGFALLNRHHCKGGVDTTSSVLMGFLRRGLTVEVSRAEVCDQEDDGAAKGGDCVVVKSG